MRVLIVEDEPMAAAMLEQSLLTYAPDAEVVAQFSGLRETIDWIAHRGCPDLLFLDIRLRDGLAWEIFAACDVSCPVIFTTAYDSHLLQAFALNGIDYLLKPIEPERLAAAIKKYRQLENHFRRFTSEELTTLTALNGSGSHYRRRFVARSGAEFVSFPAESIAYFFSEAKLTFLMDFKGGCYLMDDCLSDIETYVDPKAFFRANRQFLVSIHAIARFRSGGRGVIEVEMAHLGKRTITVSQARAQSFRRWIES